LWDRRQSRRRGVFGTPFDGWLADQRWSGPGIGRSLRWAAPL